MSAGWRSPAWALTAFGAHADEIYVEPTESQCSRTILVIDDDAAIRHLVQLILRRAGYEVLVAEDGLRGVSMAQRHRPDVIVLDLMMPVTDGYTVLDRLRETEGTRTIPVVVLTAVTLSGARYRAMNAGATAFLTKPFDPDDLCAAVEASLGAATGEERMSTTTDVGGSTH